MASEPRVPSRSVKGKRQESRNGVFEQLVVLSGILILGVIFWGIGKDMYYRTKKPHPRVVLGESLLTKEKLISDSNLGTVTHIVQANLLENEGVEIGIAGKNGAIILDSSMHLLKTVSYSGIRSQVQFIDLTGDGVTEFLNRGGFGWADASILNNDGETLWTYGGWIRGHDLAVDDMAAGHLDGDGKLDFVVGTNGSDGIRRLDFNGNEVWTQPDINVWQVEIADIDGDGVTEIIHGSSNSPLKVRNAEGKVLRTVPVDSSHFALLPWPKRGAELAILTLSGESFVVHSFSGEVLAKFRAPQVSYWGDPPVAQWVRLEVGKEPFLAVLAASEIPSSPTLYIYDAAGTLVYREVLPGSAGTIKALTLSGNESESLLLGGNGIVWQYTLRR